MNRCTETRVIERKRGRPDGWTQPTRRCIKDAGHEGPHESLSGYSWFPLYGAPDDTAA